MPDTPLPDANTPSASSSPPSNGRRRFLQVAGAATAILAAGCDSDSGMDAPDAVILDFSSDVGVLNYAYALEQLEAAFYITVVDNFFASASDDERRVLTALRDHEVVHRDFFRAALGGNAIADLEVDFSAIDFDSRSAVLSAARTFEDLGVSAYNGAGQLLDDPSFLTVAGKIVSVEARHAAVIRDLINPMSADFAGDDVVDGMGLDVANAPGTVLSAAASFVATPIEMRNL